MHAVQSAMAVRREREKREQRRQSQIRRSSSKSPRASDASHQSEAGQAAAKAPALADDQNEPESKAPHPTESSLTAFHLGVVFILLGFLMVFSAMITNSMMENNNWSSLLGVGVTFIIVGLIMVMVNRIISAREEEELAKYVSQKLARTRSGYQIGSRDVEAAAAASNEPPTAPQIRRAMSTRVHGNVTRKTSTRRSMRVPPASHHGSTQQLPVKSSSAQSHLSVKNGGHISGLTSGAEKAAASAAEAAEKNTASGPHVLVTETETLLPKQDNKPALVVTKESRRPSKRVKKQVSIESKQAASEKVPS